MGLAYVSWLGTVLISDAIRASMSIPFIFKPYQVRIKLPSYTEPRKIEALFVDGGMLNNYPIELFDHYDYLQEDDRSNCFNSRTLGMLTSTPDQVVQYKAGKRDDPRQVIEGSASNYIFKIIDILLDQQYMKQFSKNENINRTIFIPTTVNTIDFKLVTEQRTQLENNGRAAVKEYNNYPRKQANSFKK